MMEIGSQPLKEHGDAFTSLNASIDTLDLARDRMSVKPAKDMFRSASILLMEIRVR